VTFHWSSVAAAVQSLIILGEFSVFRFIWFNKRKLVVTIPSVEIKPGCVRGTAEIFLRNISARGHTLAKDLAQISTYNS